MPDDQPIREFRKVSPFVRPAVNAPAGSGDRMEPVDRIAGLLERVCVAVEELVALQRAVALPVIQREPFPPAALASLSPAENELLGSLAEGLSNKEIASQRSTSVKTVKGQLTSLYRKLNVGGRSRLLARLR